MASRTSKTTTDHDEIREWAEARGGTPAEVGSTARGGQTGIIRIDFPGFSGAGKLKKISWDEWFEKFDQSNLALVYQDTTARGQQSNFNKLVARETAEARTRGVRTSRRAGGRSRNGASASRTRGRSTRTAQRSGRRQQPAAASRRSGGRKAAPRAEAARTTTARGRSSGSRTGASRGTSGRGRGRSGGSTARKASGGGRKTSSTSGRRAPASRRGGGSRRSR